jgi:hypothetical protein
VSRREFDTENGHVTIEFVENERGELEEVFTLVSEDGLRTTTYRVPALPETRKIEPDPPIPEDYEPQSFRV